ncbi:cerberus-like [Triplophysa rosa]|uniref:Cerberus n=1 Tax=Triplophysa rosa TaxID=992332 RepID=A0A9W8C975_TRIRA|nr:cerberus-like [Triplophysa rosa]KAI7811093.1 putative cerberus [Triplophysa rosa]
MDNMIPVCFLLIVCIQMQVFGHFFQVHSSISGSGESSLSDANDGSTIEHLRSAEKLGNLTQDHANEPSHAFLQAGANDISHPVVNLAHKSSSRNAKGFWNAFLFRGKSDKYVLPIRNVEVRQEKCRALTYSQRISHENCETLEIKNNVCFGKCAMAPSGGEDESSPCPVCSPVILGSKTVKLPCVDNTEVIKVVTLIEDCRCETREEQESHHNGPVLVDPSVDHTLKSDK